MLVLPGFAEPAEEYAWLARSLGDRRVLVMSARGRGRSDAPPTGYRWEDHVDDVEAVLDDARPGRCVLVAFSRGSSYALGYGLRHPGDLLGLVIGDYHARHVGLPPEFADRQWETSIRGVPVSERMPRHAVDGVQRESVEVPLWHRLPELGCPVLLVRGTRRSALVDDAVEARYREALPGLRVATLEGAGHDLWSRNQTAYIGAILPFLRSVDREI